MEKLNSVIEKINEDNIVLVGLGESFIVNEENALRLEKILTGKNYFIVSLSNNKDIDDYSLDSERIALPFADENNDRWEKYLSFLQNTINKNLLIFELGVGFLQPEVIRFPFEKTTFYNKKATLIRVNKNFYQLSKEISERGIAIKEDPSLFLEQLLDSLN